MDGRTIPGLVQSTAGGVGRNLADCMTRLGSNPFFISLVGAQEYATTLLSKMDHMDKKGIKVLEDARTATCVVVLDNKSECVFVVGDMCIHDRLQPEEVEIHEDRIASAPLVVIDGNMPFPTMNSILNLCTKHQTPVWFEPTDISMAHKAFNGTAWRSAMTYASPNLNELKVMHDTILGRTTPPLKDDCLERKLEDSLRLGIPLLDERFHTLFVTLASHGILLLTSLPADDPFPFGKIQSRKDKIRAVHYPAPTPTNIVSVSGAGDCFAAAMISAILRGLDPEVCISAGQKAAILSLASHNAVPDSICPAAVFSAEKIELKKQLISV